MPPAGAKNWNLLSPISSNWLIRRRVQVFYFYRSYGNKTMADKIGLK